MSVFVPKRGTTPSPSCNRRDTLGLLLLSLTLGCEEDDSPSTETSTLELSNPRIVSLSPGITETLVRLGAEQQLVAVSDYCVLPKGRDLPRVGSAITPDYEAIARTRPDLIVATEVAGSQLQPLSKLADTLSLAWLELDEVAASMQKLGLKIGRQEQGIALSKTMNQRLSFVPSRDAPRILWVLDLGDGSSNTTWFIRQNSLHGAVLRASGARNAVARRIVGPPKLSPEQLLEVDPDGIIMVSSQAHLSASDLDAAQSRMRKHFMRWTPLSAVKKERLLAIHHPNAMSLGPSVLDLIPVLSQAIERLLHDTKKAHGARDSIGQEGAAP